MRQILKNTIKRSFDMVGLEVRRKSYPQPITPTLSSPYEHTPEYQRFSNAFHQNLNDCKWAPHPLYSVFTQYDQDHYLRLRDEFMHKYRCFYAVSKTISPQKIVELGAHAGSSADAYISAAPAAQYSGFDVFSDKMHSASKTVWKPYEVAEKLFQARGFKNYKLIKADLRKMDKLPFESDFVVVDAAHDFDNEYADLKLALTANPTYIFIDDSADPDQALPAIKKFLKEDLRGRVKYVFEVSFIGGGLVIRLQD